MRGEVVDVGGEKIGAIEVGSHLDLQGGRCCMGSEVKLGRVANKVDGGVKVGVLLREQRCSQQEGVDDVGLEIDGGCNFSVFNGRTGCGSGEARMWVGKVREEGWIVDCWRVELRVDVREFGGEEFVEGVEHVGVDEGVGNGKVGLEKGGRVGVVSFLDDLCEEWSKLFIRRVFGKKVDKPIKVRGEESGINGWEEVGAR
jgi:hypothetical protein